MLLDSKQDFREHKKNVFNKVSKTTGLMNIVYRRKIKNRKKKKKICKLQKILARPPLITIYKSFIRSHLDYGDIIYDQAYNVSFHQKI